MFILKTSDADVVLKTKYNGENAIKKSDEYIDLHIYRVCFMLVFFGRSALCLVKIYRNYLNFFYISTWVDFLYNTQTAVVCECNSTIQLPPLESGIRAVFTICLYKYRL